jgi:hypothetical protein
MEILSVAVYLKNLNYAVCRTPCLNTMSPKTIGMILYHVIGAIFSGPPEPI